MKQKFRTYFIFSVILFGAVLTTNSTMPGNSIEIKALTVEIDQASTLSLNIELLITEQKVTSQESFNKPFQFTILAARVQTGVLSEPLENSFITWCETRLKV